MARRASGVLGNREKEFLERLEKINDKFSSQMDKSAQEFSNVVSSLRPMRPKDEKDQKQEDLLFGGLVHHINQAFDVVHKKLLSVSQSKQEQEQPTSGVFQGTTSDFSRALKGFADELNRAKMDLKESLGGGAKTIAKPTVFDDAEKKRDEEFDKRLEKIDRFGGRGPAIHGAFAAMGNALSPNGGSASKAFSAVGQFAAMISGGTGKAAQGLSKLGEVVAKGTEKLKDWNENLRQSDLRFAEFSASMAAVAAESEVRDILRSQRQGERRSESARERERSRQAWNDAVAPIEDAWANLKNRIATVWNTALTAAFTGLTGQFNENAEPGANEMNPLGNWLENIADSTWDATYGQPPRFRERNRPNL